MNSTLHLAIVAAAAATTAGMAFGLYALLTLRQRRTTREIRVNAREHGWSYRRRHWQGDPTSFRIDGQTANGLSWIMTTRQSGDNEPRWAVQLDLRFPTLAGEQDFSIEPREHSPPASTLPDSVPPRPGSLGPSMPDGVESRVAAFSEVFAGEIGFYRQARELPSGQSAFDAAYRILVLPERIRRSPVDAALADRMLNWPANAIRPNSLLCWRSPYGLHLQARLPGPPNWQTVSCLLALGEEMITRIPPPEMAAAPHTLIDCVVARFMKP